MNLSQHLYPLYFPDATLGVVRTLDSHDLTNCGIQGVVVNTYHLRKQPGLDLLMKLGGVKEMMNFKRLVASDSGGFQLFSLIQKNPLLGKIVDEGVILYSGKSQQKKELFTPEISIQLQFAIGADIIVCLDDFSPDNASQKRLEKSVERTISWAKRCKREFEKQIINRSLSQEERPILLVPIQGQRNQELRTTCAQALLEIGFDAYGLGGWPFDEQGKFDYKISQLNAELTPDHKLRFALGVGAPENIVNLTAMGYHIFDCVLPTRDARHKRLYTYTQEVDQLDLFAATNQTDKPEWYQYLYINRGRFKKDRTPISQFCDCHACQHYSRAYINHLFKVGDSLAFRLATIHNLRFYERLVERLQQLTSQPALTKINLNAA